VIAKLPARCDIVDLLQAVDHEEVVVTLVVAHDREALDEEVVVVVVVTVVVVTGVAPVVVVAVDMRVIVVPVVTTEGDHDHVPQASLNHQQQSDEAKVVALRRDRDQSLILNPNPSHLNENAPVEVLTSVLRQSLSSQECHRCRCI